MAKEPINQPPRWRGLGPMALLIVLAALGVAAAACGGDDSATGPTATNDPTATTGAPDTTGPTATTGAPDTAETTTSAGPVLSTPCFSTGAELVLPAADWIAADVSSGGGDCLFVLQKEQLADTTVIAGELFLSSDGRSFEEFVDQLEEGLAVGQEPDILALQLLNTGATGRNLPILERIEIAGPNRAVVLIHESDRRDGYIALSAIVDVPAKTEGTVTHAIKLWGLLLPPEVGPPDHSPNYELAIDLIDSMVIVPQ